MTELTTELAAETERVHGYETETKEHHARMTQLKDENRILEEQLEQEKQKNKVNLMTLTPVAHHHHAVGAAGHGHVRAWHARRVGHGCVEVPGGG